MNELLNRKLVLGSRSPRRKYILEQAGFTFDILPADVEEVYPTDIPLREVPTYLARKKAAAIIGQVPDDALVITSDTIVLLNEQIYEKPTDRADAFRILSDLSGHMHEVITGVCLMSKDKTVSFDDTTQVYFDDLSETEINWYLDNYEYMDKAGAYAVQEGIGLIGIIKIKGCYFNVMGLPMNKLYRALQRF